MSKVLSVLSLLLLPMIGMLPAQVGVPVRTPVAITPHVVYRPTFLTADFSHNAGMAFIARLAPGGPAFLLSCHHLFGPAAGIDQQLSSEAIARIFVGAAAVSMSDRSFLITASPYLPLADARASDEKGCERDIAIFRMNGWAVGPSLQVAFADAIPGDTGWILMRDPQSTTLVLSRVSVVFAAENEVRYFLEDQSIDLSGCSGAPVVSPEGMVIAMHNGVFRPPSGRRFGFGTPVNALRKALLEVDPRAIPAVAAPPPPAAALPEPSRVEASANTPKNPGTAAPQQQRPARPVPPTRPSP